MSTLVSCQYVIVSGANGTEVAQNVERLVREGWRLHGGISTAFVAVPAPGALVFSQAMIKEFWVSDGGDDS